MKASTSYNSEVSSYWSSEHSSTTKLSSFLSLASTNTLKLLSLKSKKEKDYLITERQQLLMPITWQSLPRLDMTTTDKRELSRISNIMISQVKMMVKFMPKLKTDNDEDHISLITTI